MGEIKSTLDLVMEKTKHLSLSSEEKQTQEQAEIKKRINGLLQKYQDQILAGDDLTAEIEKLKKEFSLSDDAPVVSQLLDRLDLEKDNHQLLVLLNTYCSKDLETVESVLNEFKDELSAAASYRMVQLREDLAQKHSMSGSAVVPNLQADDTWQAEAAEIRSKFKAMLQEAKDKISCA